MENWNRVREIFTTAADLAPAERSRFLDTACADDGDLRTEVESLLDDDIPSVEDLEGVIAHEAGTLLENETLISERVGDYRVVREIGRGGMGSVYLATRDDNQYQKQVAIKVVKRGMDSEEILERFCRERQILAGLEHPYIARLIDGGTTRDGRPFFVMEYVEGEPIHLYCDRQKLDIKSRLRLFLLVCEAASYAHRNLVVHRDLKPANILVTAKGVPKLLDFGVAKLLETDAKSTSPATIYTNFGVGPLTPDYASPEQVRGLPVNTTTDVYTLGAILFELLTGRRAQKIETYTPAEIDRAVCETQPQRPSLVSKGLNRDLDNIVLMAMRKEQERRYQSVDQLADDIQRYLAGLPVAARRDSLPYRVAKFVGRHRIAVPVTVLVLAALTVATADALLQARRAEERFELVRTLAHRFLFDFHAEIENLSGTTKAQQMVVNTAVEYLDKLSRTAGSDRALLEELAEAYSRLSRVQGAAGVSGSGRHDDALISQQRSVEFYRRLAAMDPAKRRGLARSLLDLAHIEENMSEPARQLVHTREAVEILDRMLAAKPRDSTLASDGAMALLRLSQALVASDMLDEALATNLKAQQYLQTAVDSADKYRLAVAQQVEADVRLASGDVENAIAVLERALGIIEEIAAAQPGNRRYQYLRIQHMYLLSQAYYSNEDISAGDARGAAAVNENILRLAGKFLDSDARDNAARMQIAIVEAECVPALLETNPRQAIEVARSALKKWDDVLRTVSKDPFSVPRRARAEMRLAQALFRAGSVPEAVAHSLEASRADQDLLSGKSNAIFERAALFAFTTSGETLAAQKREAEARKMFDQAVSAGERLLADQHCPLKSTVAAAYAFDHFGEYWKSRGDRAQARQWFERSRQAWSARTEKAPAVERRMKLAVAKAE